MVVYFISGLGADERAFQNLTLPKSWDTRHIKWFPISKNETLESYVDKFEKVIDIDKPFALVGLSFGGIIATELSKRVNPKLTFIISSVTTKYELPPIFRFYASSGLSKMIPSNLYNKIYPFTDWSFGLKTPAEKQLLRQIISSSSPEFLKWAIHEIVCWKNTERPKTIFHVHGSMDRIFPIEYVRPDAVIPGGGHFMIFSHADVISKMLKDKLKE